MEKNIKICSRGSTFFTCKVNDIEFICLFVTTHRWMFLPVLLGGAPSGMNSVGKFPTGNKSDLYTVHHIDFRRIKPWLQGVAT